MKIQEVLASKGRVVHTVSPSERVEDVLGRFAESGIRCLAVTRDEALVGLITIRDVVAYIDRGGAAALEGTVGDAMVRDVTTVTPETTLEEAEAVFERSQFHHLPVVEAGALVGVVTPADVLGRHVEELEEVSTLMRDYCSGVYY